MPHMLDYVVRRLMLGLVTLFGVAVIVFFVMRVLPGRTGTYSPPRPQKNGHR